MFGVNFVCLCHSPLHKPELVVSDQPPVLAVRAVVRAAVRAAVRVPVGQVEAETVLAPPLLFRKPRLFVVARWPVFFLQAAQRHRPVDRLEDDGAHHLQGRGRTLLTDSFCFFFYYFCLRSFYFI